jgi:hypothetical protein
MKIRIWGVHLWLTAEASMVLLATGAATAASMAEVGKNGNLHEHWNPGWNELNQLLYRSSGCAIKSYHFVVVNQNLQLSHHLDALDELTICYILRDVCLLSLGLSRLSVPVVLHGAFVFISWIVMVFRVAWDHPSSTSLAYGLMKENSSVGHWCRFVSRHMLA